VKVTEADRERRFASLRLVMSSSMMVEFLSKSGGVAVVDGGLATELERHGADLNDPLWSAKCLLTSPQLIRQVSISLSL